MSDRDLLVGVDIGSSGIKTAVFDCSGKRLGEGRRDNHPDQPRPGVAQYDGNRMVEATVASIREAIEMAGAGKADVAAIAFDGMISGVMGVDSQWNPTTAYTTPLDMRFGDQLDRITEAHGEKIRRLTGSGMAVIGPKIAWLREAFPEDFARTEVFVTATGFVVGKLAGLRATDAFIDSTYLWTTGLSDTLNDCWSEDLCESHGVDLKRLPKIVRPMDIVGRVTEVFGEATGLGAGVPIVAGAGDQSAGFVGAGMTRAGILADVAGTYPILALSTDDFVPDVKDRRIELFPSPVSGQFHACFIINGGGLTHHWFGQHFGEGGEEEELFAQLDTAAAQMSPGCDGLFFSPHLGGRVCPIRTNMKGAWVGFTWTHQRSHFYRALLESIAFEHALGLRALRKLFPAQKPDEIRGFGGGSKSALWNQIKADVLGLPYRAMDEADQAVWGDAVLAGCAVGLFDDLTTAWELAGASGKVYRPEPSRHAKYEQLLQTYEEMTTPLENVFDRLQ